MAAAVEQALTGLELSPARQVLAAQVRKCAAALDAAAPTDVAKVSRELSARWAELMSEVKPRDGDDDDWTRPDSGGDGSPAVRDTA